MPKCISVPPAYQPHPSKRNWKCHLGDSFSEYFQSLKIKFGKNCKKFSVSSYLGGVWTLTSCCSASPTARHRPIQAATSNKSSTWVHHRGASTSNNGLLALYMTKTMTNTITKTMTNTMRMTKTRRDTMTKTKTMPKTLKEHSKRDLWPLRLLITVMRRHDLTNTKEKS